jgi:hypothetical protein
MRRQAIFLGFLISTCSWSQSSSPPATKLEGFAPTEGAVIVLGFEAAGSVAGISVETRQIGDSRGMSAQGLAVDVSDAQGHKGRSYIDADEIPELMKGFTAILQVAANPTQLKNFEVRYKTRGEFEVSAFSNAGAALSYSVRAGRGTRVSVVINSAQMERLRSLVDTSSQKLASLGK